MYLKLLLFVMALHSMKALASSQSYDIPMQRRYPQQEDSRIQWIGRGENHDRKNQRHDGRRFANQRQEIQDPYQQRQLVHPIIPSIPPNHPAMNFPVNLPALNVPSYFPPSLNYPAHRPESENWPSTHPAFVRPESENWPVNRRAFVRPESENWPSTRPAFVRPESERS